jgi:hypothetical protein
LFERRLVLAAKVVSLCLVSGGDGGGGGGGVVVSLFEPCEQKLLHHFT